MKRLDDAAEAIAASELAVLAAPPPQQQQPAVPAAGGTATGPGTTDSAGVDLAAHMVSARLAVLEVRANVRTIDAAREMYESVLDLGRPA